MMNNMVKLNCGHCVEKLDDASIISVKSYTQEDVRAVDYLTVCQPCYDQYVNDGCVVEIIEEQGARRLKINVEEKKEKTKINEEWKAACDAVIRSDSWWY